MIQSSQPMALVIRVKRKLNSADVVALGISKGALAMTEHFALKSAL